MTLSLQDWAAISEIVGGLAVLVTLIYLSIQVRQANKSLRISTSVAGSEYNGAIFSEWVTNSDFVDIYLKGMAGLDGLSNNEKFRFLAFVNHAMRYFEHQFVLHENDALPDGFWYGQEASLRMILNTPGVQDAWERQKVVFSGRFRDFIDGLLQRELLPSDGLLKRSQPVIRLRLDILRSNRCHPIC